MYGAKLSRARTASVSLNAALASRRIAISAGIAPRARCGAECLAEEVSERHFASPRGEVEHSELDRTARGGRVGRGVDEATRERREFVARVESMEVGCNHRAREALQRLGTALEGLRAETR